MYIAHEDEDGIVRRQHFVLVVALTLDLISLALLIKHTPSLMVEFRKYLYLIQARFSEMVILLATDIHMDLLFLPIPLFPESAGYCIGILCRWGVPIQKMTGIAMLLLENVGIAIMLAVLFRHQAILIDNDPLKLRPRTLSIIRAGIFIVFNSSIFAYIVFGGAEISAETNLLLDKVKLVRKDIRTLIILLLNISWVRERVYSNSQYVVYDHNREIRLLSGSLLVFVILIVFLGVAVFSHMFYSLYTQERKRSISTLNRLRKTVFVLIAQLLIPLNFTVIPGILIFTGITFENTISFELSSTMFFIQSLHSIAHNLILLSITSAYRGYIFEMARFCFLEKRPEKSARLKSISTNVITLK